MSANSAMVIKLGELHGVKLSNLKEKLEKQRNDREETKMEEERVVPELKSKSINIDKLKQNGDHIRKFVSEIRNFMMENAKKLSIIQDLPAEERELAEDDEKHLTDEIEKALRVQVASAKIAALTAYAIARATFCDATKNNVSSLLADLSDRGILIKTISRENAILAWNKKYIVAPSLRQSSRDIEQTLVRLVSKARLLEKAEYEQAKKALIEKTNLTINITELFDGKTGRAGFEVPAKQLEIYEKMEIIPRGFIVIENDGKKIAPIAAAGEIKQIITELREKKTALLPHVLGWNEFRVKIDDPEYFRRLYILFNLLKSGLELHKKTSSS